MEGGIQGLEDGERMLAQRRKGAKKERWGSRLKAGGIFSCQTLRNRSQELARRASKSCLNKGCRSYSGRPRSLRGEHGL